MNRARIIRAQCDACGNDMTIMLFGKPRADRPKRRCVDCRIAEETRRESEGSL